MMLASTRDAAARFPGARLLPGQHGWLLGLASLSSSGCGAKQATALSQNGWWLRLGDLWMWLQLMWLQFEVVRGPVVVDLEPSWSKKGPKPASDRPQTTPTGLRTSSHCSHMSCSHVHRSPSGKGRDGRQHTRLAGRARLAKLEPRRLARGPRYTRGPVARPRLPSKWIIHLLRRRTTYKVFMFFRKGPPGS